MCHSHRKGHHRDLGPPPKRARLDKETIILPPPPPTTTIGPFNVQPKSSSRSTPPSSSSHANPQYEEAGIGAL